jgi:hypothetical protein
MVKAAGKQFIRDLLDRMGLQVIRTPSGILSGSHQAENLSESLLSGTTIGMQAFPVSVHLLTWDNGFSLHPQGWNPYAMTASALLASPSCPYEASPLARFYAVFQPTTAADYLCPELKGLGPLSVFPADSYILPWNLESPELRRCERLRQNRAEETRAPGGIHGINKMGPVSPWKGAFEFDRLRKLVLSITEKGYRHSMTKHIEVAILRYEGELRFVIRSGYHRAAVLSALGHTVVPVLPKPACILDMDLLGTAPALKNGYWVQTELQKYFAFLFTERGNERAASLGLL